MWDPHEESEMASERFDSAMTRRAALQLSGAALVGLSPLGLTVLGAQAPKQEAPPDTLVEQKVRDISELPMNADGTAREFAEGALTPIAEIGAIYRNKQPQVEFDPAKARIRIRGNVMKLQGALGLEDLKKLAARTQITKLQCGAPKPSGIVKWGGVRFTDLCRLLQVQPMCQYVMFVGADGYITTEDMSVATHPQTMLAWEMNGAPIPPEHGAPFRIVIPTRFGGRNTKAIAEIRFTATSFGYNNG
jgi:DMSO/TMAO reductase YedYZ molybdopterin-dependent catalytic subunit